MVCKRCLAFLSFAIAVCLSSGAQDGKIPERRLERIKELYDNDMFSAVREEVRDVFTSSSGISGPDKDWLASYYILSSIRLGVPDVDALMDVYTGCFRSAPEYMGVMLEYAGYYFDRKEYAVALRILDSTDYALLSRTGKEQYLFQRSFCQLRTGNTAGARNGFNMILKGRHTKYTVPSTYYAGYIAYMDKDFKNAVRLLSSIRHDAHFGAYCAYYILESKLMMEDYGYVTDNGAGVFGIVPKDMKPKVARIISQAYYSLGRSDEAERWFKDYSSSGAGMSRKDNYYLGIISYANGSYYAAVDAFGKVVSTPDSLAQNAYMHLANSYLKLRNKHEALRCYRKASEMTFDRNVREESYYNYAKLAFDVNSDITVFPDYLAEWPEPIRSDEIYSYMAESYLLSKNYKAAISALSGIRNMTPEMEMNLQKAAFLRGLELYGMGSYGGAVEGFRMSSEHSSYNRNLGLLTRFWLADALYRTGNAAGAAEMNGTLYQNQAFRSFKEYPYMLFGQGYCYYAMGNYEEALEWFYRFLELRGTDMDMIIEARLRVGDALFMLRDYAKAASVYEEVSMVNYNPEYVVYAAYQCALAYGLVPDTGKKIEMLESIVDRREDTPLYPRAVYELGRTYVQEHIADKAERCFKYLLNEVRDPLYEPKAMLELGMLYSNAGDYERAVEYLTGIVERYPLSEDTENALAVIESIYSVQNRPEEYFAYLDRVGMSDMKTPDERESMLFSAAEQTYLSGDYVSAEKALESFIKMYPDGQKTPLAYFYLAESFSAMNRKEEAASAYRKVMDTGSGSFVELSTLKYAGICYGLEEYGAAASAYEDLLRIAQLDNNRNEARKGLMRSYFMDEKYNLALDAASQVLDIQSLDQEDAQEAQYITAKSCISLGRRDEALPILRGLARMNYTPLGAEACYLLIQDTYDAGNFEEVENLVYAFSDSKTDQMYWLAKSFIVLGDSFAEREEWEQAVATFQSIKDGYSPSSSKDDVLEQVEMRLERLDTIISAR